MKLAMYKKITLVSLLLLILLLGLQIVFSNNDDLYSSVVKGNVRKVRKFIKRGADINVTDQKGQTPLHRIAGGGFIQDKEKNLFRRLRGWKVASGRFVEPDICLEIAKLLIDNGADIHAKDFYGHTPLHKTGRSRNSEVAKLLITSGADVNAKDDSGQTPLLFSLKLGTYGFEVPKVFIDNGADVNATDCQGDTPLHETVLSVYAIRIFIKSVDDVCEMIDLLLKKGANINAINKSGNTALHEVIDWAIDFDTSIEIDADIGHIVQFLIKNGANLNAENNQGQTPLTLALEADKSELVELLRQLGAKE